MYLASPTIDGLYADIGGIKEVIGDRLLMVDEAHGAFGYFMDDIPNAMGRGADMACTSTHKTIGGMWGKSFVMNGRNSRISRQKFESSVKSHITSSLSMGALADIEGVILYMAEEG